MMSSFNGKMLCPSVIRRRLFLRGPSSIGMFDHFSIALPSLFLGFLLYFYSFRRLIVVIFQGACSDKFAMSRSESFFKNAHLIASLATFYPPQGSFKIDWSYQPQISITDSIDGQKQLVPQTIKCHYICSALNLSLGCQLSLYKSKTFAGIEFSQSVEYISIQLFATLLLTIHIILFISKNFPCRLLEQGYQSDIVFIVHGKSFCAHRCVLGARSAYFAEMFETKWKGKNVIALKHPLVRRPLLWFS